MKKLIAIFAVVFAVGVSVMASEPQGIPWNCTDLSREQELAAASSASTDKHLIQRNKIMLALLGNPADFATFAQAEAKIAELCPELSAEQRFEKLSKLCFCQHGNYKWGADMAKDARRANCAHWLSNCASKSEFAGQSFTVAERKENLKSAVQLYLQHTAKWAAVGTGSALRRYINLSSGDDNAVVVPFLQEVYRKALPKVSVNDVWKPVAVTAGLALKARGVNVE